MLNLNIFNSTRNVRILVTIRVILKYLPRNHVKPISVAISIWILTNIHRNGWDLKLTLNIFNITRNVRILMTLQAILKYHQRNHVKSFLIAIPFEYWQTKIEMGGIWSLLWIFSISPEMSGFYWQFGWYWNIFREITSNHFKLLFLFGYWQTK